MQCSVEGCEREVVARGWCQKHYQRWLYRGSPEVVLVFRQKKGSQNPAWKGDDVGYFALHRWMRNNFPKTGACEHCGELRKTQYAQKDPGSKSRDRNDWLELCVPCHAKFDGITGSKRKNPKSPETRAKIRAALKARRIELESKI